MNLLDNLRQFLSYLQDIQPRPSKVCNCDGIWFDPNRSWIINKMRRNQTVKIAPWCCTVLVFTCADVLWYISPVRLHQSNQYRKDLHYNITSYWEVHNTPLRYMDRDGWIKCILRLSSTCFSFPLNTKVSPYDRHYKHFGYRELNILWSCHIQYFILTSGGSVYHLPSDNEPNVKFNNMYGNIRMDWMRKDITLKFNMDHMNSIPVETLEAFNSESTSIT